MSRLTSYSLIVGYCLLLAACGSGTSGQNLPAGTYQGTLTPGLGNATSLGAVGCTGGAAESVFLNVAESGSTSIVDYNITPSLPQTVANGSFTNPVNQNNPCFNGTINFSNCTNMQSATLTMNSCIVNLIGNSYVFQANYIVQTNGYVLTGTINASK